MDIRFNPARYDNKISDRFCNMENGLEDEDDYVDPYEDIEITEKVNLIDIPEYVYVLKDWKNETPHSLHALANRLNCHESVLESLPVVIKK